MNSDQFLKEAYTNIKKTWNINKKDLAVVWQNYTLGFNKAMIAVIGGSVETDAYFVVTYNYAKKELYIDRYEHVENREFIEVR